MYRQVGLVVPQEPQEGAVRRLRSGGGGSARRKGSKAPSLWSLNGLCSGRSARAQATPWRRSARAVSRGDASDAFSSVTGASGVGSSEDRETSTLVLHRLNELLWELEFSEARSRSSSALDADVKGRRS